MPQRRLCTIMIVPRDRARVEIVRRVANYPTWSPDIRGYEHSFYEDEPDNIARELLRYDATLANGGVYYYRPQWAGEAPEPLRLPA